MIICHLPLHPFSLVPSRKPGGAWVNCGQEVEGKKEEGLEEEEEEPEEEQDLKGVWKRSRRKEELKGKFTGAKNNIVKVAEESNVYYNEGGRGERGGGGGRRR